jgi:drug/metabolite transporter (DMT)-like permease
MLWLSLTLISALAMAFQDVFSKKVGQGSGTLFAAWMRWIACVPFLLVCVPFIAIPKLSAEFYLVTAALIPLEIWAVILYVKAIRISPLNVTLPFLSLTPVFMILTGYVYLGEVIRPAQVVGIVFIAAGGYFVNIHTIKKGIFQPILAIGRERGSVYMIVVALLYSITSVLGKRAVILSDPVFFGVFYVAVVSAVMTPIVFMMGPSPVKSAGLLKTNFWWVALLGLVGALGALTHFTAISMVEAATMQAVKRTSLLFGIVLGRFFFDEPRFGARLLGGFLMMIGVLCIYFL